MVLEGVMQASKGGKNQQTDPTMLPVSNINDKKSMIALKLSNGTCCFAIPKHFLIGIKTCSTRGFCASYLKHSYLISDSDIIAIEGESAENHNQSICRVVEASPYDTSTKHSHHKDQGSLQKPGAMERL